MEERWRRAGAAARRPRAPPPPRRANRQRRAARVKRRAARAPGEPRASPDSATKDLNSQAAREQRGEARARRLPVPALHVGLEPLQPVGRLRPARAGAGGGSAAGPATRGPRARLSAGGPRGRRGARRAARPRGGAVRLLAEGAARGRACATRGGGAVRRRRRHGLGAADGEPGQVHHLGQPARRPGAARRSLFRRSGNLELAQLEGVERERDGEGRAAEARVGVADDHVGQVELQVLLQLGSQL